MRMLIYCMIFGIIHLFVGLGIKGYMMLKQKDVMSFVCDVVLWYVFLIGLILLLVPTSIFASLAGTCLLYTSLALVMALISSYKNRAIDPATLVFGEVGLSGEVRAVSNVQQRVMEAKKLGFKRCILPAVSVKSLKDVEGIELVGVKNIKEAGENI